MVDPANLVEEAGDALVIPHVLAEPLRAGTGGRRRFDGGGDPVSVPTHHEDLGPGGGVLRDALTAVIEGG